MNPADWTDRARGALLVKTESTSPPPELGDAFRAAAAVADLTTYRTTESGVVGDHHADASHRHSVRITATTPFAATLRVVAIQDGEILALLDLDETLSDAFGHPSSWADPGTILTGIMHAVGTAIREGMHEDAVGVAHRWGLGVAATACAAAGIHVHAPMTTALPSPFTEGEIDSSFFSTIPADDRSRVYEAMKPLRRGAPTGLVATCSETEPKTVSARRLRISTTSPSGALDRMRAIVAASELHIEPEDRWKHADGLRIGNPPIRNSVSRP